MKLYKFILTFAVFVAGAEGCGGSSSGASSVPTVAISPPDVTVIDGNGNRSLIH